MRGERCAWAKNASGRWPEGSGGCDGAEEGKARLLECREADQDHEHDHVPVTKQISFGYGYGDVGIRPEGALAQ